MTMLPISIMIYNSYNVKYIDKYNDNGKYSMIAIDPNIYRKL